MGEFEGQEVSGSRYKVFSEDDKQVLVLDELLPSGAGRFTCVAENELGVCKWTANVRIDVPQGETVSPDSAKKGKTSPLKKRTASPKRRESSPSKSKKTKRSKSKDLKASTERSASAASGKMSVDSPKAQDVV